MRFLKFSSIFVLFFIFGCSHNPPTLPCAPVTVTAPYRQIAPQKPRTYYAIGDSITEGSGASAPNNSFFSSLTSFFNYYYPNTTSLNFGIGGETSTAYLNIDLPTIVSGYQGTNFITVLLGMNDLIQFNIPGDPINGNSVFAMPLTQAAPYSLIFKSNMISIINALKTLPNTPSDLQIVIGTNYNTGEKGTYWSPSSWPDGNAVFNLYNQRVVEVAQAENISYVDLSAAFSGHPEYISSDGIHPTDAGHLIISHVFEGGFK